MWRCRACAAQGATRPFTEVLSCSGRTIHRKNFGASAFRRIEPSRSEPGFHNPGARERIAELRNAGNTLYPRISKAPNCISCKKFIETFKDLEARNHVSSVGPYILHGTINSTLFFLFAYFERTSKRRTQIWISPCLHRHSARWTPSTSVVQPPEARNP
jgi:hypothetical protein